VRRPSSGENFSGVAVGSFANGTPRIRPLEMRPPPRVHRDHLIAAALLNELMPRRGFGTLFCALLLPLFACSPTIWRIRHSHSARAPTTRIRSAPLDAVV